MSARPTRSQRARRRDLRHVDLPLVLEQAFLVRADTGRDGKTVTSAFFDLQRAEAYGALQESKGFTVLLFELVVAADGLRAVPLGPPPRGALRRLVPDAPAIAPPRPR